MDTIILSITATIISIVSIFITLKNDKRQIRINKLEELLEINLYLLYHYDILNEIFELQTIIRNPHLLKKDSNISSMVEEENKLISSFIENTGKDTLTNKIIRLEVLSRSYLPNNNLKFRVISLGEMYSNLLLATIFKDYEGTKNNYSSYPKLIDLFNYVEKIENDIISEMKLGYKTITSEKVELYRLKLKKDLKIS